MGLEDVKLYIPDRESKDILKTLSALKGNLLLFCLQWPTQNMQHATSESPPDPR